MRDLDFGEGLRSRESLGRGDGVEEKAVINFIRSLVIGLDPRRADVGRNATEHGRKNGEMDGYDYE